MRAASRLTERHLAEARRGAKCSEANAVRRRPAGNDLFIHAFYILMFVLALFSALMVVFSTHAVYSALYLILTMISLAALFILMNAQLAAAFQIIVYAGAIMVLFMFVIMLLQIGRQEEWPERTKTIRWLGGLLSLAFVGQIVAGLLSLNFGDKYTLANAKGIDINSVAENLMTNYIYAFEMTSVLLLIAVVGAVVLARRFLVQGRVQPTDNRF